MGTPEKEKATFLSIALNTLLLVLKLIAGILSHSLALIAESVNSLTDILSNIAILFAVRVSSKRADRGHPFGHHRVEPLAAFVVAIFTGIFGFEIVRSAIQNLASPIEPIITLFTISVPVITIAVKGFMAIYFSVKARRENSPGLKAIGIDARNDICAAVIVLIAVIGAKMEIPYIDSIAALVISTFIFYAGYQLGIENVDYLIGKSPPSGEIKRIIGVIKGIRGVRAVNHVRAHYVGNYIHIEVHIEVNGRLATARSHNIGRAVQQAIERISSVDKAFIHIEPVRHNHR